VRFAELLAKSPRCPVETDTLLCAVDDYIVSYEDYAAKSRVAARYKSGHAVGPLPTNLMIEASRMWAQRSMGHCEQAEEKADALLEQIDVLMAVAEAGVSGFRGRRR
jgi:hypothetical protein